MKILFIASDFWRYATEWAGKVIICYDLKGYATCKDGAHVKVFFKMHPTQMVLPGIITFL